MIFELNIIYIIRSVGFFAVHFIFRGNCLPVYIHLYTPNDFDEGEQIPPKFSEQNIYRYIFGYISFIYSSLF